MDPELRRRTRLKDKHGKELRCPNTLGKFDSPVIGPDKALFFQQKISEIFSYFTIKSHVVALLISIHMICFMKK